MTCTRQYLGCKLPRLRPPARGTLSFLAGLLFARAVFIVPTLHVLDEAAVVFVGNKTVERAPQGPACHTDFLDPRSHTSRSRSAPNLA